MIIIACLFRALLMIAFSFIISFLFSLLRTAKDASVIAGLLL